MVQIDGWTVPDSLIREPPSITLVVSIIVGSLQLCRSSDGGAVHETRSLGLLEGQSVACGDGSVVEHDTYEIQRASRQHWSCDEIFKTILQLCSFFF